MAHRTNRPPALAAAAALLIAAASLTACGSSSSAKVSAPKPAAATSTPAATTTTTAGSTAGTTVPVKLSEFKIVPAVTSAPAGHVVFDLSNVGHVKHQFTVIRTDKSAATVLSKHNPNDDIPGARAEVSAIQPGANAKLVIKDLKPGHYALVCALPGHYQGGMHADFTVT